MAAKSKKSDSDPWLVTALIWLGRASLIAAVVGAVGKYMGKAAREVQKLLSDEHGKPRPIQESSDDKD